VKVRVNQVHDQIQSRCRKVKEWRYEKTTFHSPSTIIITQLKKHTYHYQNCNLEIHIIDFVLLSTCTHPRTAITSLLSLHLHVLNRQSGRKKDLLPDKKQRLFVDAEFNRARWCREYLTNPSFLCPPSHHRNSWT
jgi:hypothetical protein